MNFIDEHPYITTDRVVTPLEQSNVVTERSMELYEDRIVTARKEFKMHTVVDMSFRQIRGEEGFLYLHTNQGVFSFNVKVDPAQFIEKFKEVKKS